MNDKIVSMTVGPLSEAVSSVSGTVSFNPQMMSESHEVLAEQAQVASIRLQLILKPASKKEKKVPCLLGRSHHSLFQMDGGIVPLNGGVSAFFAAKI